MTVRMSRMVWFTGLCIFLVPCAWFGCPDYLRPLSRETQFPAIVTLADRFIRHVPAGQGGVVAILSRDWFIHVSFVTSSDKTCFHTCSCLLLDPPPHHHHHHKELYMLENVLSFLSHHLCTPFTVFPKSIYID